MAIVDFPELSPKSWHFLNHREAAFVVARIEHDRADVKTEPFVLGAYLRNAFDSKVWAFAALYMFTTTVSLNFSVDYFPLRDVSGLGFIAMSHNSCNILL